MATLNKTAGQASIQYTASGGNYVCLQVFARDGLLLGSSLSTEGYKNSTLVLNKVLEQISNLIPSLTTDQTTDAASSISYLNSNGSTDFATVINLAQDEERDAAIVAKKVTPNTTSNLNTQLKAIHARLDRIDDDLISHYAGISQLVTSLLANPFTSGSAALSFGTYNFSSAGQAALKKLMGLVPGYDTFKQLQHLDTAALVDALESSLENQVSGITQTLENQLNNAINEQVNAFQQQATALADQATAVTNALDANTALNDAISSGANAATIATLTAAKATADQALINANGLVNNIAVQLTGVDKVNKSAQVVTGFLNTLTDITKGKTHSAIFHK